MTIVRRVTSGRRVDSSHQLLEQYKASLECSKPSGAISFTNLDNRVKMQPTTSSLNDELESVDLNTDNLPAVDTPDACDKAAMR